MDAPAILFSAPKNQGILPQFHLLIQSSQISKLLNERQWKELKTRNLPKKKHDEEK